MQTSLFDDLDLLGELKPINVAINQLFLNPNNPRIMGKSRDKKTLDERIVEEEVQISVLGEIKSEGLGDILEKVKKVGFLPIDRIVVRKLKNFTDKYVVLEGNRRVSALKILKKEHDSSIDTLRDIIYSSINEIEVLEYEGEDENIEWLLQGLRHINGIKQWGALQQARFLYEMNVNKKLSPTDLNRMTSLGRNSIASTIKAYIAWQQAKETNDYDIEEEHFSLFSEAVFKKPKLKDWLGWDDNTESFANAENLDTLLSWYIGNGKSEPKVKRVIDIRDTLPEILNDQNNDILDKLKNNDNYNFEEAAAEISKKKTQLDMQKDQLNLEHRLVDLDNLYSIISTLPMPQIAKSNKKDEFKKRISDLKDALSTMQLLLEKL